MKEHIKLIAMITLLCVFLSIIGCDTEDITETQDQDTATESESITDKRSETEPDIETESDIESDTEHKHDFSDASCTQPRICKSCGESEGEPLGHSGGTADCQSRAKCEICGEEYGDAGDHKGGNATCNVRAECEVCGTQYGKYGECDFSAEVASAEYLVSVATMARPAVYLVSCTYCGTASSKKFTSGGTIKEMLTNPQKFLDNTDFDGEYFLFFTDPHPVTNTTIASIPDEKAVRFDKLGEFYELSGAQFMLCGGDWFNNSNSRESAIDMMKWIKNKLTEVFGEKNYLVVGNHDNNYQTKNEAGATVAGDQTLTQDEIADAWFSEYGKTYYSFEARSSKFYVFDTGIDWGHEKSLTDLDREQIAWFLSELEKNDDKHIVLAPHIVHVYDDKLHVATQEYAKISSIYNARGKYEYDGREYDFSKKTGLVEFMIAGHNHASQSGEVEGIPYFTTPSAAGGGECPTSDFVFVDYGERRITLVRIGDGESREIALIPIE